MSVREYGRRERPDELEVKLVDWLDSEAPAHAPTYLAEQVLRATAQVRQRSRLFDLPAFDLRPRRLAFALTFAAALVVLASFVATVVLPRLDPGPAGPLVPAGELNHPRVGHTATLLPDGRVLIVGGEVRRGPWTGDIREVPTAEIWDPATRGFSPAGALNQPRSSHTATALPDGSVLIVGGMRVEGTGRGARRVQLASAEIWHPGTRSFIPAGSLGQARYGHTATLLRDGRVLVVGGTVGYDDLRGLRSAEIWDPSTKTFVEAASLPQARSGHTSTLLADGRVLIAGGSASGTSSSATTTTELWDPTTEEFKAGPPMTEARVSPSALLLADGKVLIVGGGTGLGLATAELWDPMSGEFSPAGTFGREGFRSYSTIVSSLPDGRVAVFGLFGDIELWDPKTLTSTLAGSLPDARTGHTATSLPDGRVLIVGGYGHYVTYIELLASAVLFDASAPPEAAPTLPPDPAGSGSFRTTVPLPEPGPIASAALLPDGRVLVYGGDRDPAPGECEEFRGSAPYLWDPDGERFEQLAPLPQPRQGHTLVPLSSRCLLAVGGVMKRMSALGCHDEPMTSVALWDPIGGSVAAAGSLIEHRVMPGAVALLDGRVLVIGDTSDVNDPARLRSAEVWDPATNSVEPAGLLSQARSSFSTTLLSDGRVLVVGGVSEDYAVLRAAEVWDPTTNSFSDAGSLGIPRNDHTATLLADGRVLIIGGRAHAEGFGWRPDHATAEIWDPSTSTFTSAGSLPQPRPAHTSTLLADGRVLVVSGAQALIWDPATNGFADDALLRQPRLWHTAALLADGRVLVIGGVSAAPEREPLSSVEIYVPASR